jgi:hypothetical protein
VGTEVGRSVGVAVGIEVGSVVGVSVGVTVGVTVGGKVELDVGALLGVSLGQGPQKPSPLSRKSRMFSSLIHASAPESMQTIIPVGSGSRDKETAAAQRTTITHSSGISVVGAPVGDTDVVGISVGTPVNSELVGLAVARSFVGWEDVSGLGRRLGLGLSEGDEDGSQDGAIVGHCPQSPPIERT